LKIKEQKLKEIKMTTSDMIRQLCERMNISLAELCRRIGQTPQNFNKKLKRGTVSFEEMMIIATVLNVKYEQAFVLSDGEKIGYHQNATRY
jgi:transcriptional regulator with XRE-family HTH domain